MLSPYENVIIGNFLYALGLAMGRQSMPVDGCVNLLQQTPADPALGDLMLQFPGVWRLIEFKRDGGDQKKEDQKRSIFLAATNPRRGMAYLREVSKQVHWYADPQESHEQFNLRVRPYLDPQDDLAIPMMSFAQDIVEQACLGRFTDEDELADYMAIIKTFAGARRFSAAGLLVGVSAAATGSSGSGASGGGITYLPVSDFTDLRATARMLHERYVEQQRLLSVARQLEAAQLQEASLERAASHARTHGREMSQGRGRGGPDRAEDLGFSR